MESIWGLFPAIALTDPALTRLWSAKTWTDVGRPPLQRLIQRIYAAGLQHLHGLPCYACGGGEGQTISKKQSKKGPGEDRNEEGEQTAQNPSLGAMGTMETEEDPFHGTLVGALQEHHGMPMTCNWHAKPPSSYNDGCGLSLNGPVMCWPAATGSIESKFCHSNVSTRVSMSLQ